MATLSGFKSPTIAIGGTTSCAVDTSNELVVWGTQPSGQPTLTDAVSVQTNEICAIALRSDGTVVGWGGNNYDQLDIPVGLSDVVQIAMGAYHCLALKSDGTVVGWGLDNGGQATIPVGLSDVVQVSAGGNASFALKSDGTLVGWGNNGSFQQNVPAGIGTVTQISVGNDCCMALIDDGTIETWGSNTSGQLDVPASVTAATAVAAGRGYGMAIQGGAVVIWGDSSNGLDTPPAAASSNVIALAANSFSGGYAMCLLDDGTVLAWGRDYVGETSVPGSLVALAPGVPPTEGLISAAVPFSVLFQGEQVQNPGSITAQVEFKAEFKGFDNWLERADPLQLQEVYRLVITGAADGLPDLIVDRISSWQATNQAGDRSAYIQAVIPAADEYVEQIEARQNGELVIQKGYRFSDGSSRYEEILRSSFDTLRPDEGQRALTITVSGYFRGKPVSKGSRTLTGIRSISTPNGKRRVRCDIDFFLQPGMTVDALGKTFTADYINYYVNESGKFAEVGER